VVELINTIAGQTNLLALNATIEAARLVKPPRLRGRGVGGESFGRADREGDRRDQSADQRNPGRHAGFGGRHQGDRRYHRPDVGDFLDHCRGGGRAGTASQEISANIQHAAEGTSQVSSNITNVQRGASETGSASAQVHSAAKSLSSESNRLKLEVSKFLNTVRAA